MAIQLGMRLKEILFLQMNDIDLDKNRLMIYKSKTGYKSKEDGREIVLTIAAKLALLQASKQLEDGIKPDTRIITLSQNAFKQSWQDLIKRAGINSKEDDAKLRIPEGKRGLEFTDLRREAGSRFDEAGLTNTEHDLMLGHDSQQIREIYKSPYLDRIEKKLNEYWMSATDYHDADLKAFLFSKIDGRPEFIIQQEKDEIRRSDERAKMLADKMKNDPAYRKEVEAKLEAFHKQQEEKKAVRERQRKAIDEATNVVKFKRGSK